MSKLTFAFIVLAATLAGCGDKDDTAADTATGETETETDTAAEQTTETL